MKSHQIYLTVDRSGSMAERVSDTLSGIKYFMASLGGGADTHLTLTLFDQGTDVIFRDQSRENWVKPSARKFRLNGGTALMDALGETIKMAAMHEPRMWVDQEENVITVVIITDGDDNASKFYTPDHIADLVNYNRSQEWNFVFLTTSPNCSQQARGLGIPPQSSMRFNPHNIDTAIHSVADALNRMISGVPGDFGFNNTERVASN